MASTKERLLGFSKKRILTEDGWLYFCVDCHDYHKWDAFYRNRDRPFGIMPTCSKSKKGKQTKSDPELAHLKLGNVTEKDIQATIDFLELMGYDTTGNVHEQFLKKYEKLLSKKSELPVSKRPTYNGSSYRP